MSGVTIANRKGVLSYEKTRPEVYSALSRLFVLKTLGIASVSMLAYIKYLLYIYARNY